MLVTLSTVIKQKCGVSLCRRLSEVSIREETHSNARTWLSRFSPQDIPKDICDITYTRASGPGGQHVNKVHTKANLRIKTKGLMPLVPKLLHPGILRSRYYAPNSETLVITSDETRGRASNLQECYKKLYALIVAAGREAVRGETAPDKVAKVKALQHESKEHRVASKKSHGAKKAARANAGRYAP